MSAGRSTRKRTRDQIEAASALQPAAPDSSMQLDPAVLPQETAGNGSVEALTGAQLLKLHVKKLTALSKSADSIVKRFHEDSETMFTFDLPNNSGRRSIRFNAMILQPELYGNGHLTTVWADEDLPDDQTEFLDSLGDSPPKSLEDMLLTVTKGILGQAQSTALAAQLGSSNASGGHPEAAASEEENSSDTDADFDEDLEDDPFGLAATAGPSSAVDDALCRDFVLLREAGYRPGYQTLSDGSKVISISVAISKLNIPIAALHAWDAKLLNPKSRLTLLIAFQIGYPQDSYDQAGLATLLSAQNVRYVVGLSERTKPSAEAIAKAFRQHSEVSSWTPIELEPFSLSTPLTDQLKNLFPSVLDRRRTSSLSWAEAEDQVASLSPAAEDDSQDSTTTNEDSAALIEDSNLQIALPPDPLTARQQRENVPLCAFVYLIRRFAMCPRNCLICHRKVLNVTVRPYVCADPLCSYQYMTLGLGPEIEFEIVNNSAVVDLLISLAYASAAENELKDHPPAGMGIVAPRTLADVDHPERWVELESLETPNSSLSILISLMPPVLEMKKWLEADDLPEHVKATSKARKLSEMRNGQIHTSVWLVLRWIIASNTSYIREIEDESMLIRNLPRSYKQFIFISGAPEKEQTLQREIVRAQGEDANAIDYPTLYAFHGSAVKNWHSILRQGLHFQKTTNGRAYGHGVYFALDGQTSLGTYATVAGTAWKNSESPPGRIAAVCEILNQPQKFVSSSPYLVVNQTQWIVTRFLAVQQSAGHEEAPGNTSSAATSSTMPMDPRFRITMNSAPIAIPNLKHKLENDYLEEIKSMPAISDEYTLQDQQILDRPVSLVLANDAQDRYKASQRLRWSQERASYQSFTVQLLDRGLVRTLPAPEHASPAASLSLSREVKAIMAIQTEQSPQSLGFYYDPGFTNDNLFHWIIELTGFDPELPLARDMVARNVPGVLMEVLFPSNFPFVPPFFRVIHPRFLPFIQGGGGHVTGGGSICMDLLTTDGWSSLYNVEGILTQIRMAMSNLEPKPARLAQNWDMPYGIDEAIAGFKRAASTHNWKVPKDLDKLSTGYM